jgi:ATP-dependent protease HslVU (ClpYQ) peptidase subunit
MTTIAYRDGIIAADSQVTHEAAGDKSGAGSHKHTCQKLYTKKAFGYHAVIATAGESAPGMLFVDWYGKKGKPPEVLHDTDFTCLVLDEDGLWEFNSFCRAEKIEEPFYAIGSGAKAALGAMHMGASAIEAVEIAKKIDPYTGGKVTWMRQPK